MDGMTWINTMFPGVDESRGWEENLKRVINYDYQLKEYLDWQMKHLNTDNFNPVDWSNVQEEIISLTASSLTLEVSNDRGASVLLLKSDGVTVASSGDITLGGNVVFRGDDLDDPNNVTTIIGNTVDTAYINALGVTAAAIRATGSDGAYLYGGDSGDADYMLIHGAGFDLYYNEVIRAALYYEDDLENTMTLRLGNDSPAFVQKYYAGGKHYLWIGGEREGGVGLRLNLSDGTYKLFGTAES